MSTNKLGTKRRRNSYSEASKTESHTSTSNSEIDTALAEFFFGCNIPFSVVESKLFKKFVSLLNPSYQVPSRKRLSTSLSDRIHHQVVEKLKYSEEIDGVLLIDGWKNSSANTKNVVCTIYTKDHKNIFLNSWDFTETRETGDELARVIEEAVIMAKEKYNIRIYAVVSDNASSMMKMGRLVDVWHTTCHSHSANLLLKSLVDSKFAESLTSLERCTERFCCKTNILHDSLKDIGNSLLPNSCDVAVLHEHPSFKIIK